MSTDQDMGTQGRQVRNRTIYYHRYLSGSSTPSAHVQQPATSPAPYYGGSGGMAYGGNYGAPYGAPYYGGNAGSGSGQDDSLVGTLNIARIIRVCFQHWMTIFVFLVLGALGAFVVFQLLPVKYEAVSTMQMSVRTPNVMGTDFIMIREEGTVKEVFNTRLGRLQHPDVFNSARERYRTEHATSDVTNEEIVEALSKAEMELIPFSHLITLTVRTGNPQFSANLANAYALACETAMQDMNRSATELAVATLSTLLDSSMRSLEQKEEDLLEYRKSRQLDVMQRTRDERLSRKIALDTRVVALDSQITQAREMARVLSAIQDEPDKFAMLPVSIPRASEIASAFEKLQEVSSERQALLIRFTENHPDVQIKQREEAVFQNQFKDAVVRAHETARAELMVLENQRQQLAKEAAELAAALAKLDEDIISTEVRLQQMERSYETEREEVNAILVRKKEAELQSDQMSALIQQIRAATPPEKPVSPKAFIVFPAGIVLGLLLGIFFVLLLDHMEDKLIGVPDIEQRLRLKALAVFPHLRRKQRNQVALTVHAEPFSQYAEAMAGLRNLLDSPRYHDLTKVLLVMSTQPAEGKTCSATNLAISYAQSGQRTLLVDFDMRRPRLAGIFGKEPGTFQSLPHTLAKNKPELFDTLPIQSEVPSLDIVLSRASSRISPSVLMGTNIITEFFDWARNHYDRIIVDSPPFGLVGDTIVLANLVDSVILVATPDKTRFGPIQFASRRLAEVGARLLGVIVNNVDFGRWASFSKYEVRYGYTYNYRPVKTEPGAEEETVPEVDDTVFAVDVTAEQVRRRREQGSQQVPAEDRPVDSDFVSDDE